MSVQDVTSPLYGNDCGTAVPLTVVRYSGPMRTRSYSVETSWTGNQGTGTSAYTAYSRNHELSGDGKAVPIPGSSDPAFRGDAARYNPEELLLGAISACHMLWFLHLCANKGIVVTAYADRSVAVMQEEADGAGQFVEATLQPLVTITDLARIEECERLHHEVHNVCTIARSVNFRVHVRPRTEVVKTL